MDTSYELGAIWVVFTLVMENEGAEMIFAYLHNSLVFHLVHHCILLYFV